VALGFMFLPWTQNIQGKGKVTFLKPEHRPQTIHATIAGRIEKWYVQEGEFVKKGDTIVHLSEIKTDYFDPDIINRTGNQILAKSESISAYQSKINALDQQINGLEGELKLKMEQLDNKIVQLELKIEADSIDLIRAELDQTIAQRQLDRTQNLEEQGIKAITDVEDKSLKAQQNQAKYVSATNKLATTRNELTVTRLEKDRTLFEYQQKIAKTQSDKFSAQSTLLDTRAQVEKLKIQETNYRNRSSFYFITAPQDAYINQALVVGLGETVKEGEKVVSVLPADNQLAVEMFVDPIDLPLLEIGNPVRFLFDGWPAFVFAGWPGFTFGTFEGNVVAIENTISYDGKFRILVQADPETKAWPKALRAGSGARGIALLNRVPLWYELWRQLNGFPPDYYDNEVTEDPKFKAPLKNVK
ncbi:MAG: HlyD family efflux transporter periplasmic adaptor subunit, partial [Bacteroidota bacterium]